MMLTQSFKADELDLVPQSLWRPYPTASERDAWEMLPQTVRRNILELGKKALDYDWKTLLASKFLSYVKEGTHYQYDLDFFERRASVIALAMAECVEGKGRFIEHLVDGLWLICEETFWGTPPHLMMQQKGSGLPDVTEPTVDLFVAETGMMLAYIDYLLASQLDAFSPFVRPRITFEIKRRLLVPAYERDDFHWMAFRKTNEWRNNWSPWICSNWLACVLLIETNPLQRQQMVYKIMQVLDNYLDPFPNDGGCDEGPNYWGRAAASVFDCLELLHQATKEQINFFSEPLIRNMANFIYRTHISSNYFVNFADGSAVFEPDAALVFAYGLRIYDHDMQAFGAWLGQKLVVEDDALQDLWKSLINSPIRGLRALFSCQKITQVDGKPPFQRDAFWPDVQIMIARDQNGSDEGLFVAAKGGHNNESHNHNDVGEYIVYIDGKPLLIDVGVESYTRKTFSDQRYELWTMQSVYHNLPTVNGIMQSQGKEFCAKNIDYQADDSLAAFSLDIAGAYPLSAGVKTWKRTIQLQRGKYVTIKDQFELNHMPQRLSLSLLTVSQPLINQEGIIHFVSNPLIDGRESASGMLNYQANIFVPSIEMIVTDDPRLVRDWGHQIYRILLKVNKPRFEDCWVMRIGSSQNIQI